MQRRHAEEAGSFERVVFRGRGLALGEFHCHPDDPRWTRENANGAWHLLAFPRTSVRITHTGADPLVANPNHVVYYNRDQPYRRALLSRDGDRCLFLAVDLDLLAEVLWGLDPPVRVRAGFRFGFGHGPVDPGSYLTQRMVARHLAEHGSAADPLYVEEALHEVLARVLGLAVSASASGSRSGGPRRPAWQRTRLAHARLAETTKALLTVAVAERSSLDEVARAVGASPFHLARVFHAQTGTTIHGYRNQLRLRYCLERLCTPGTDLTETALSFGYSSHGHFTDSFRAQFGVPPSRVRHAARARDMRELRRILEVAPKPGP